MNKTLEKDRSPDSPDVPLIIMDETGSTSDDLWERWRAGRREPLAILARRQRRGRGQFGRSWFSGAPGNLHLSILHFVPAWRVDLLPFVPLRTALHVIRILALRTTVTVGIRWPNDLMVDRGKLGGILVESRTGPGDRIPVVIGLGLNLNAALEDFPSELRPEVAILGRLTGRRLPVVDIARDIIYSIDAWFNSLAV